MSQPSLSLSGMLLLNAKPMIILFYNNLYYFYESIRFSTATNWRHLSELFAPQEKRNKIHVVLWNALYYFDHTWQTTAMK